MHFLDLTWCVAYYYPLDIIRDVDFCIKDIALGMFLIFFVMQRLCSEVQSVLMHTACDEPHL